MTPYDTLYDILHATLRIHPIRHHTYQRRLLAQRRVGPVGKFRQDSVYNTLHILTLCDTLYIYTPYDTVNISVDCSRNGAWVLSASLDKTLCTTPYTYTLYIYTPYDTVNISVDCSRNGAWVL